MRGKDCKNPQKKFAHFEMQFSSLARPEHFSGNFPPQVREVLQGKSFTKKKKARHKFSKEEDSKLLKLVEEFGEHCWTYVAKYMDGLTPRQCRERYQDYLSPGIKNQPWTVEEDNLLKQKYSEFGPKWTTIAKFFDARTDVNVKNRWTILNQRMLKSQKLEKEKEKAKEKEREKELNKFSYSRAYGLNIPVNNDSMNSFVFMGITPYQFKPLLPQQNIQQRQQQPQLVAPINVGIGMGIPPLQPPPTMIQSATIHQPVQIQEPLINKTNSLNQQNIQPSTPSQVSTPTFLGTPTQVISSPSKPLITSPSNGKAPVTVKYAQRSNLIPVSQNQKNNADKDDKDGMFDQTTGSIDAIEIDSHEYDIKSF